MLGRNLLVAAVARPGARQHDVYLPAGAWFDYWTNERLESTGRVFAGQPLYRDNLFRLPTYARAGAILPRMHVDEQTMNVLGKRADASRRDELIVRVYAAETPSTFTLYEDDGASVAYLGGAVHTTDLAQQRSGDTVTVLVASANGTYSGAPASRNTVLELVVGGTATEVTLNGSPLDPHPNRAAFDAADSGWVNEGGGVVLAKSGDMGVDTEKTFVATVEPIQDVSLTFVCHNGHTLPGTSVYVVGSIEALGNWDPTRAVKLEPTAYPRWVDQIDNLPASTAIEWKCIKRTEAGDTSVADEWEPDPNNAFTTAASGTGNPTFGNFQP